MAEIAMEEIDSGGIFSVGHDPETNTGRVRFRGKNGEATSLYEYQNCTAEEADSIKLGGYSTFAALWKFGKPYSRIE